MQGLLIVDKPPGPTSHDVVARVRAALGGVKVGHTGTLDPSATGVLVLAVGNATRVCRYLESSKEYVATVLFGVETDTLDVTGTVVNRSERLPGSVDEIRDVCATLQGDVEQVPPMFSAVHREGARLYHFARKGITVDREARKVTISVVEVLTYEPPRAHLRVVCGPGTYVRVIASTLGEQLGCGACLESLRRTRVGAFRLDEAASLEKVLAAAASGKIVDYLVPASEAVAHLPTLVLSHDQAVAVSHGKGLGVDTGFPVRMCTGDGALVAIGEVSNARPVIVLTADLANT